MLTVGVMLSMHTLVRVMMHMTMDRMMRVMGMVLVVHVRPLVWVVVSTRHVMMSMHTFVGVMMKRHPYAPFTLSSASSKRMRLLLIGANTSLRVNLPILGFARRR